MSDFYQRIGQQALKLAPGPFPKVLVYSEAQSGVISADVFFQVGFNPVVSHRRAPPELTDLLHEFWENGDGKVQPRSWAAIHLWIEGGAFRTWLIYPGDLRPGEYVDRRRRVVADYFPLAEVDYSEPDGETARANPQPSSTAPRSPEIAQIVPEARAGDPKEKLWHQVYDARQACFESTIGPLPTDILKITSMIGVWPGGGLFVIPASRLGPDIWAYTTFGLTNPDMPTTVTARDVRVETDAKGRLLPGTSRLRRKVPAPSVPGRAGYGYEILMLTNGQAEWPISFLKWAVNAELAHDAGLLDRVERHAGVTIEEIEIGAGGPIDVIIAKAQAPLPGPVQLPNGAMQMLVATTITAEEMKWSFGHGRPALLERLARAGIGQTSVRGRSTTPV